MDDSAWKYDEYEDHSDLSGMLTTNRDSASEDEDVQDERKSMTGSESTFTGSGSNATLVDNKENRTPFAGTTPASRLSSTTQINRKKKDRIINVSAVMDRNQELERTVYDLKMKIGAINRELPWIMIDGKDHIAEYIQFKNENEELRMKLAESNRHVDAMRRDNEEIVMKERDRLLQEHADDVAQLRGEYERVCQEYDVLREEVGQSNPSPRDFDRSMMSDGSMWSDRSRQVGMFELRIEGLQKDLKAAKNAMETERTAAANARRELNELRRCMEEKEKEWERRASIANLQETFHIGIQGSSRQELMEKIEEQMLRIDSLEHELKIKTENENKMAGLVKDQMKMRADLENELRAAREASVSIMENKEVDEIMRELLELSAMNTNLQEECRRRGAMGMGRKKDGNEREKQTVDVEEIKKELETTVEICQQYQKIGDRIAPLQQRIVAMNKSVLERRSFLEGLKGFEVSGLTPIRLGEGSYGGNGTPGGTPGTPTGRGPHTRLLHSVLQKSVMNVSHAEFLNCSMNTSQGIKIAKDRLVSMMDSCKRLFEKLQSSYSLFNEIRLALGGEENSELLRQMEDLRIDLEGSVMESGETAKAIEVVENSLFELQSMLDASMGGVGRESDFNLSNAFRRVEKEERRKDMTYSIEVTATGERQSVMEERTQLASLLVEHEELKTQFHELEKKNEEIIMQCSNQNETVGELKKEREELYREVEGRREKEARLLKENQNLMNRLEEAVSEVQRRKDEIEDTVSKMQDQIDRLDSEAFEANRLREMELRVKEEEIVNMRALIEEKETEMDRIGLRMEDISKELDGMKEIEDRIVEREERKMSRLEKEIELYKEKLERTNEEYVKLNEELETVKKREDELEKKLQKYKLKVMEEAEKTRKANERDESSTQTSLTMEKLSRMEWSTKELQGGLTRLGRTIEDSFLEKGQYIDDPHRCFEEIDVNRLVDIVTRVKAKNDENMATMEKTNEVLRKYIDENKELDESKGLKCGEDGDGVCLTVDSLEGKFEDPLRQLLYAFTAVSNEAVQSYKNAQKKMMSGGLSQNEYTRILMMMRDVRDQVNKRYMQTCQKSESSEKMGDAKTILKLEYLMEENKKLKTKIINLTTLLRSNCTDEEKAKLVKKIDAEMAGISKTLKDTVGVKGRLPSSSTSTRKI